MGHPYFPLRLSRARAFGGSANALLDHGLRSSPLDPIDFEQRAEVPGSGWPFDLSALRPYYKRAQPICGLGRARYAAAGWVDSATALPLAAADALESVVYQFGPRSTFPAYLEELASAEAVQLLLHANVVELATDEAGDRVRHLEVATLAGNRLRAQAQLYVLATGGIENARLLLLSRAATHPTGLGNAHDLVGRHFMEHLHLVAGFVRPDDPAVAATLGFYQPHEVGGTAVEGMLRLREEERRREGLLNAVFHLRPTTQARIRPAVRAAGTVRHAWPRGPFTRKLTRHARAALVGAPEVARAALGRVRRTAPDRVALGTMAEQAPDPASRVTLGTGRDRLDLPVARLDWRVGDRDRESLRRSVDRIDEELRRAGLGRVEQPLGEERPPTLVRGGWHHMGTTRMHGDPRHGVVDAEGRVHGTRNLYVAGSSVFPTGGAANPTLTIVALALRLAEHLRQDLGAASR